MMPTAVEVLAVSEVTARTLGGAVLGALLGAGVTLTITGRRERRSLAAEDLATVRLIEFELGNARRAARYIKDHNAAYTAFPVTAWESGRVRLARALDPVEWLLVLNAYDAIHGMNWRYQHDKDFEHVDREMPELHSKQTRDQTCAHIIDAATPAIQVLRTKS